MSVDNAVLNLILLFFRHFHIPVETVFPKEWKDSHTATNKKRTRYPYSRKKKSLAINHPVKYTGIQKGIGLFRFGANIRILGGCFGSFMMTNKGAALRYKHICSRDCSPLQASLTSPIHFDKGWRLFPHLKCVNVKMLLCLFLFYLPTNSEECNQPAFQYSNSSRCDVLDWLWEETFTLFHAASSSAPQLHHLCAQKCTVHVMEHQLWLLKQFLYVFSTSKEQEFSKNRNTLIRTDYTILTSYCISCTLFFIPVMDVDF